MNNLPTTRGRPVCIDAADALEHGPRFLGTPERWLDDPHWRCENGHVSTCYLKSEELGRDACLECRGRLWITFPEDTESNIQDQPTPGTVRRNQADV